MSCKEFKFSQTQEYQWQARIAQDIDVSLKTTSFSLALMITCASSLLQALLTRKNTRNHSSIRKADTEAGMLPGITQQHNVRSKFYWFSEFCNSQWLSHFAAPFIVTWAETSVAESCYEKYFMKQCSYIFWSKTNGSREQGDNQGTPCFATLKWTAWEMWCFGITSHPDLTATMHKGWWCIRANDPSAGSPTETLLRLLLPLSDKVH